MEKIIYAADLPKGFVFGTKTHIVVGTGELKENENLIQNNSIVKVEPEMEKFKRYVLRCPSCRNEDIEKRITFEPGRCADKFANPRVQAFCKECKEMLIIPLNAVTHEELRRDTLYSDELEAGIVVRVTDKIIILGTKKVRTAATVRTSI